SLSACEGCRTQTTQTPKNADSDVPEARLYLVSDMAGALEPCGCVKDQLGGLDHLGALVSAEKSKAKAAALLSSGPLYFMDIELGIIGVAAPDKAKVPLDGVTSSAAADAVRSGVDALKKDGVAAVVVLAAVGRGEAKRIADVNPDLLAIVVGSTGGGGEANTT